MTSPKSTSRKTLLLLSLVLSGFGLSLVGWRVAASQAAPPPHNRPTGLAAALNPDGSLKPGARGSFDTSGYRMELTANSSPRFVPMTMTPTCNGWDTQFSLPSGVSGQVNALVLSGTNIYVGGSFSGVFDVAANNVARFDTLTNTWSALGMGGGNGVNSVVSAFAVSGNDLYLGGDFTTTNVGGTTVNANRVVKFNTTTGAWSALGTNGNGVNSSVTSLVVNEGTLYVGGEFMTANVGGTTISTNRVAKVDVGTGVWSALGTNGSGVNSTVTSLALLGNDLYVGGVFTSVNSSGTTINANRVAKVDRATQVWSTLGTNGNGVDNPVHSFAVSGNDLYVGGSFTTANVGGTTVNANRVAKFTTTTGVWSALGPNGNGVDSPVVDLALNGNVLYMSGLFTMANVGGTTISANRVAKIDLTTGVWSALGTNGNGVSSDFANALAVNGDALYVGGLFTTANLGGTTISADGIARVDTTTGAWSALGPNSGKGVNNQVKALVVSGTDVYVGGDFTLVGNVAANRIAKFDALTNSWGTLGQGSGNGVDAPVTTLAINGNDLYVGGSFRTANVGGTIVSTNRVARVNTTTGVWSKLGTNGNGVDSGVTALALNGSDLYLGGFFSTANVGGTTVTTNYVAKFNTMTGDWGKLGTDGNGVDGSVLTLTVSGNDLFVGGVFMTANVGGTTVSTNRVAKVNTATGIWSKLGTNGNGVNGTVQALAVSASDLFVGGQFTMANVGGTTIGASNVAKVNLTTSVWSALGNGVSSTVSALALSGSDLYVGGLFRTATVTVNNIAKVNTTTNVWSALADTGGGSGVDGTTLALAASGGNLYVGGSFIIVGDKKVSQKIGRFCSNSPPMIAAVANTRQQGAPASTSIIATASDLQQSADSLTITVNGNTSAVVNGVIVSALSNPDGTISASIGASCTATTATFTLRATDNNHLFSEATLTVNVNVETTPPDTNIISMPVAVSDTNASFSFTGTDNCTVNSFECKLDNGNWTACTSSQSYSGLPVGAHTFQVQAKDTAGNIDLTPATYHWQVFIATCGTIVNPATLPQATRGKPFMQTLSASPTGSYTFSLYANTLPPGVSLVNTLGIYSLRGTPTASGTYSFTIKAKKNNSTCEGIRNYTMTIP